MNKIDEAYKEIITEMMKIAGYDISYEDLLKEKDGWWARYTMTQEHRDQWVDFSVNLLRNKLRWSKRKSVDQMKWVDLMWGLRVVEKD
jgi:hypothetical protein